MEYELRTRVVTVCLPSESHICGLQLRSLDGNEANGLSRLLACLSHLLLFSIRPLDTQLIPLLRPILISELLMQRLHLEDLPRIAVPAVYNEGCARRQRLVNVYNVFNGLGDSC